MPYQIDETHDPKLQSWVESANDLSTDFPIQNLPFVIGLPITEDDTIEAFFAIAIGDSLLDPLACWMIEELRSENEALAQYMNDWIENPLDDSLWEDFNEIRASFRLWISGLLRHDSALATNKEWQELVLFPAESCDLIPATFPGDYTDFYASINHATNVGSMFRPDNPLLPNYKHIPIGYHGRASSIVPSGTSIKRPVGQQAPSEEGGSPSFGPCKLLDYEMEMGVIVGKGNDLGESVSIENAEDHLLGMCILNDWSARDLQKWEYVPLGPFLAKNFASTVSPHVVTMEALAPFRCEAMERDANDPQPLPYMDSEENHKAGGIDITVEVYLSSAQMREQGIDAIKLSSGNFKDMYWTVAQMLTHHTVNGCNMNPGDLLGSGTISGTTRDSRGSLLELTWDGDPFANPPVLVAGTERTPIVLPTGEERKFIADGDEIIMIAFCEREGYRRIGFGECRGIIEPANTVL